MAVMYHKNCMTNYIMKFKKKNVSEILDDNEDQCDNIIIENYFSGL